MSGDTDKLAQIEDWVCNSNFNFASREDVLALVEIAKAAREAANPTTTDGNRARPFMWKPANDALCAALSALDGDT